MTLQNTGSARSEFTPVLLKEVELSLPLQPQLDRDEAERNAYERLRLLVALHSMPLGVIDLKLQGGHLSADELVSVIWRDLGHRIADHMRQDDIPFGEKLTPAGLPFPFPPKCTVERDRLLARAPFASVVVATRDRPQLLAASLTSLLAQDYPRYEIIVVDNAPTSDSTAEFVKRSFGHSSLVRYVREDLPGTSWARNLGIREARGEFVAFADDDVLLDSKWLAGLAAGFQISPQVGCVTGMILPLELETQAQMWIEQYGGFTKGFERRVFDVRDHRPDSPLFPYNAGMFGSGANMAFRTTVLREMGGFDSALGGGSPAQGGEDLAAFFQVLAGGYQLVYEPSAIVRHNHIRNYSTLTRKMYGYGVGLSAYLTKSLYDNPEFVLDFITKIPRGLSFVFSSQSSKNSRKGPDYPRELTSAERKGMLVGPFAYFRGRHRARQLRVRDVGSCLPVPAAIPNEA